MALVSYGQPNKALFVPVGIGGGGNLTSIPSKWYGVGQELDYHETNVKDYATSGNNGDVAIKPALRKAINILSQSSANSNRHRMVVIFGNSPITDGDQFIDKEVAELEAHGAHIFTNVIRRYTGFEVADYHNWKLLASARLRPHRPSSSASQPSTKCASPCWRTTATPPTNTGQVMGISKDGEIPCSWLDGTTQCNIQGSCKWNADAARKCPSAGQCPNLECQSLPAALADKYACENCRLVSGAFDCSYSIQLCSRDGPLRPQLMPVSSPRRL